jgi:starvation-inducible DNA-binding protein
MEQEMSNDLHSNLAKLLADTYAVYLKTQNYHWHVKGPLFKSLHTLFEEQYIELANAVDEIAERILTLGRNAPATLKEFTELTSIKDGDSSLKANDMVTDLFNDHEKIIQDLYKTINSANAINDEGSASLLGDRIAHHEKIRWMLGSSKD